MFRIVKVAALVAGAMIVASGASQAQTIYGHENSNLTRANTAMMAGDFESASKYFGRAVKANLGEERLVPALNNYCAVEYALGRYENAEEVCSIAIGEDRRYWRAFVNRGNARSALGKLEEAKADFERAIDINPKSKIANSALISFQAKNGTLLAEAGR